MVLSADKTSGFAVAKICPICNAVKKCATSRDGKSALCWNVESNRQTKIGNWFHWIDRNQNPFPPSGKNRSTPSTSKAIDPKSNRYRKPFQIFKDFAKKHSDQLDTWAEKRSVTKSSLVALGVCPNPKSVECPERSTEAPFDTCGFVERYWEARIDDDGSEQRFKFSGKRGFQFVDGWPKSQIKMLLIVEGMFCVASALDAGFCAIGRFTRAADLRPLAGMLKDVSPDTRIIVICENDDAKPGRKSPLEEVKERASELASLLGRPVLVASPPSDHKDVNDWWVSLTDGKGHELPEKDRTSLGWQMHDHLMQEANAQIIEANKQRGKNHAESIEHSAELYRFERREKVVDLDYDTSNTCTYQHVFTRSTDDTMRILGTKLACGCWRCYSCRQRLLYPTWTIAIVVGFCDVPGVYTRWLNSEAEAKTMKRDMQASGGKWATIRTTIPNEDESLEEERGWFAISNRPIRGKCTYYDFIANESDFDYFCKNVGLIVASVDGTEKRPIATSKGIKRTERPSRDDWRAKLEKILSSEETVYAGFISPEQAAELRSLGYRSRHVIGMEKMEFLTIDLENKNSFALCSKEFDGCGLKPNEALKTASELIANPLARIMASSKWFAQKTKGWDRTGINKGPSEVRSVAKLFNVASDDVDFGALASIVDASSIRIEISQKEKFLGAIENGN